MMSISARRLLPACALFVVLFLATTAVSAEDPSDGIPGFVDGKPFAELAGEDAVTVEFSLRGALLTTLASIDPDLKELAGGLESIHAVILEMGSGATAKKLREFVGETEKELKRKGWEQLLRVHEGSEEVRILVLSDEETIQGLVVMAINGEDGELVFVNVAGEINLSAIAALGERLDVPGLNQLKGRTD